jgi:hypothetical protein
MGLLSALVFYKLGKRSVNKRIRQQTKRDAMKPDFSNLDPDGEELAEAQQLYEDFVNNQAEEHMLLEEEKETKEIKQPYNGPYWEEFTKRVRQSNEATMDLLKKLEPGHIKDGEQK